MLSVVRRLCHGARAAQGEVLAAMRVFMIGGTGLLGSEAARELIARSHEVTALALPPLPKGVQLPPEMRMEYG